MIYHRVVVKSWGPGIFRGYQESGPWLLFLENRTKIEPKEIPSHLIPLLLAVFTRQLEILVTTLIYHQVPIRLLELTGRASGLRVHERTSTAVDNKPRYSLCLSTQHLLFEPKNQKLEIHVEPLMLWKLSYKTWCPAVYMYVWPTLWVVLIAELKLSFLRGVFHSYWT